jgi:hypothetical protein
MEVCLVLNLTNTQMQSQECLGCLNDIQYHHQQDKQGRMTIEPRESSLWSVKARPGQAMHTMRYNAER